MLAPVKSCQRRRSHARHRLRVEMLEKRMLLHGGTSVGIELMDSEAADHAASHVHATESTGESAVVIETDHSHSLAEADVMHSHGGTVEANPLAPPTLALDATESEEGLIVMFDVSNFEMSEDAVDGDHVDGQGHLHLYVDGEKISRVYDSTFELAELSGGYHIIHADLNSNDHRSYMLNGEKIEASIEVYSEDFIGPVPMLSLRLDFGGTLDVSVIGVDPGDLSASAVGTAGDFNGDGVDDFIVSAPRANVAGVTDVGEVYVVYGSTSGLPSSIDLSALTGLDGFRLIGPAADDMAGVSIGGGGDINGDGFDDIVIGAPGADPLGRTSAGSAFVVFGSNSFGAAFNLGNLNGANGFRIDGAVAGDDAGRSVAIAADVNEDGIDDVVVGAPLNDASGEEAGAAYVVYGSSTAFPSIVDLASLPPTGGFRITGESAGDNFGYSVESAGDVDGDLVGDLVIGAPSGFGAGVSTSCDPANTVGLIQCDTAAAPGYTLFAPNPSTNTYLVDQNGFLVNSWSANNRPGFAAELMDDGSLIRAANTGGPNFNAGGNGGAIEIYDWDGNLTWRYSYSNAQHRLHHDFEVLPNGNVLMIAWELKSGADAIAAGRDPATLDDGHLWPDHIIEVEPTGATTGDIVWEWHAWDHLVQDFDSNQANFGNVANNPQLIDLNFMRNGGEDWLHFNAIDYNADLDQILLSVHGFSEIWVIDHSTTTAEAASHSGGNSGKGGDILYRWGNPQAYDRGTTADRELYTLHDAAWIESGLPGAGNILIFNNGQMRPGGNSSSVEEISPPVDAMGNYTLPNGDDYGPDNTVWTWSDTPATDFFAQNLSAAHRLANGNTLITHGPQGRFLEVDAAGNEVFEYINPVRNSGPVAQGTNIAQNAVFRANKYDPSFVGFAGKDLTPGGTVETGGSTNTMEVVKEGAAYVLLGDSTLSDQNIGGLNGSDGFKVTGVEVGDQLGLSVSGAGDVNGDGLSDVIFGAPRARVDGVSVGAAYVMFGMSTGFVADSAIDSLDGTNGYRLAGNYESDPLLSSLIVNADGTTGYNGAVVNFDSVIPGDDYVHIHTSGIPHHATVGPWGPNPNDATDQDVTFYIPRNPEVQSGNKSATRLGAIGTWIDGTAIFNWSDARSYQNAGNWNQLANIFEAVSFDACGAHPPGFGQYHTHGGPDCLIAELNDDGSSHSPILGWSFDGFPIYGSYGYINGDPNAGVERIESSWQLRNITSRTNGPTLAAQALGSYLEDYEYVAGSGHLDEYNGHFAPTPEYPNGIYHYRVTFDSLGEPAFPYVIGLEYNGVVGPGNAGNGGVAPTLENASISVGTAGDLNSDGFADVVVGDPDAHVDGVGVGGSATVVHGHGGTHPADFHLHNVDQSNGVQLVGDVIGDQAGAAVGHAGDVNGDGVSDLIVGAPGVDDGGNNDGEASLLFGELAPEPTVEGVVINGDDAQRSSISELTVTFDREVMAPSSAFVVMNQDTNEVVDSLIVQSSLIGGKTVSSLTFAPGSHVVGGSLNSLVDGNYRLDINGSQIVGMAGGASMSSDFVFGQSPTDAFFRKYGDHNGNDVVDLLDFSIFRQTFGKTSLDSGYVGDLDSDGDDSIGLLDFSKFRQNFGT